MKRALKTASLAILIGAVCVISATPTSANNRGVDTAFQSLNDISMFYQGLINTGR